VELGVNVNIVDYVLLGTLSFRVQTKAHLETGSLSGRAKVDYKSVSGKT
jgi:hypothetical protein